MRLGVDISGTLMANGGPRTADDGTQRIPRDENSARVFLLSAIKMNFQKKLGASFSRSFIYVSNSSHNNRDTGNICGMWININ